MNNKIEFTDSAKKEIERIVLEKETKTYFRISVQGGGCSGFKYNFSFDDKIKPDDIIFNKTIPPFVLAALFEANRIATSNSTESSTITKNLNLCFIFL